MVILADVKWIKICTDIFGDEKIQLIEDLPEGDGIIVIWFKLLCMAGKQNNGGVFMLNERIAYTDDMLATLFRRPINIVRLALNTFEQFGMIEIVNNAYTLPNWEKHQSLDKLEQLREKNRERVARHREKQKLLSSGDGCNVTVMKCNAIDIDKEIELDKEININNNKKKNEKPYKIIVDYLNEKADTSYRASSKATQSHINARLSEGYTVDDFKIVIDKQCTKWKGTEYEQYLRPSTLFGNKFENYLNGKTTTATSGKNDGWCFTPNEDSLDDLF